MITIYTAIYGDCDKLHQPAFQHRSIRYLCFTDNPSNTAIGVETIIDRPHECPARANRWHKTHPPSGTTIYVDGSYQLVGDPREFIDEMAGHQVALVKHNRHTCAYQEAIQIAARRKDEPQVILRQMMRYDRWGMPPGFGLWEGGVIYRHKETNRDWQDLWWKEIEGGSYRDQISLAYSLWQTKQPIHELASRPACFKLHDHVNAERPRTKRKKRDAPI